MGLGFMSVLGGFLVPSRTIRSVLAFLAHFLENWVVVLGVFFSINSLLELLVHLKGFSVLFVLKLFLLLVNISIFNFFVLGSGRSIFFVLLVSRGLGVRLGQLWHLFFLTLLMIVVMLLVVRL